MRRQFLKSLILAPLLLDKAFAQSIKQPSQAAIPYKEVNIPQDRNVVRLFISFDCAYSMETFDSFVQWGQTLPKSLRFEIEQVAASESTVPFVVIWNAVKKAGTPKEQMAFASYFFNYVRDQRVPPSSPEFYTKLFKDNKIPNLTNIVRTTTKKEIITQVRRDASYKVSATPSLGIGGRYWASPEGTGGDYGLYMELANGLVSQILT